MIMSLLKQRRIAAQREPYALYEDGMLFIDCRMCTGPSSLADGGCVKCVSGKISDNGIPVRLLMRKDRDVEHSNDTVAVLGEIAKIGSLTGTASSEKLSGRCAGCQSSLAKNAKDIWDSFPEPRFDIMRLEAERSKPEREECEECLWKTIGFIDQLESMFITLKKSAAKKAFRLTEV
ncbi:MAG: hypothetical protein LBV13_00815 [Methanomassiliicoccaceae archaeon]|jgi:hypothetical protein|nr:hypothetical protein [Methanomassiliicoccaceae archaeon]